MKYGLGTWYNLLSRQQRIWLLITLAASGLIFATGLVYSLMARDVVHKVECDISLSIRDLAPRLGVTGRALARELGLPLDAAKKKPLQALGIKQEQLQHAVEHILSHRPTLFKYYFYLSVALFGLIFLAKLGRPEAATSEDRHSWYPRGIYLGVLVISVAVAGFLLGKSPNPMEGIVKVFKSMAGLYPDPGMKVLAFVFFLLLAWVGNKMICGWVCPFGALQELAFSLPVLSKLKRKKLPFIWTNSIRALLFFVMLLVLFGVVGNRKGLVIYHFVNPFNLFNLDFDPGTILVTVILVLLLSLIVYRPFCRIICPFGFASWIVEQISIFRIRINHQTCISCGACSKVCPTQAAEAKLAQHKVVPDCFSCARCLRVCPVDAICYGCKTADNSEK